jgi:hypothetical protein
VAWDAAGSRLFISTGPYTEFGEHVIHVYEVA